MKFGCLQLEKRQRTADNRIGLDSVESVLIIRFPLVSSSGRQ